MRVSLQYRLITCHLPVHWDAQGTKYADLTIVQNGRDLAFLEKQNVQPLVRIPLSVHPEILAAGANAATPESRPPASFLWFGSWVDRKGVHYLPGAVRLIAARHPEARFTLGGTGVAPDDLLQKFAPETRDRITVLPRISREEQIENFSRNAIFLFPSLSEGFGYALIEAMCMGLAPITTTTGMGGDYLTNRQNAMIVPPTSAEAIAESASELIEKPDLRCRLARAAQQVAGQFTTESMIDAYEATFLAQHREIKGAN
jgi:glycosyltransferase involved in cell wall biosynthesis